MLPTGLTVNNLTEHVNSHCFFNFTSNQDG